MKTVFTLIFVLGISCLSKGQDLSTQIEKKQKELESLKQQQAKIDGEIIDLKHSSIIQDLKTIGLPSDDYVEHSAMILSYAEEHEQARWVAHIILADIINGKSGRSNDFRTDPKVSTGTAVEEDYFLKTQGASGETEYDGFGWDRGHLAPSADFRWSPKALSESYFYSNISPQAADFNRGIWKDLEGAIRYYLYQNTDTKLYVVTVPILQAGLPVIERSVENKISIPKRFVKVVLDQKNKMGIAFVMENKQLQGSLKEYAISIDQAEEITGFDFFDGLDDEVETSIESSFDIDQWLIIDKDAHVEVIDATTLPKGHYNTEMAMQERLKNSKAIVCGTIVNARKSRKGNYWVNLDAPYPNSKYSFWIKKENLINFSVLPGEEYFNQKVCVEGVIKNYGDNVSVEIDDENAVRKYTSQ